MLLGRVSQKLRCDISTCQHAVSIAFPLELASPRRFHLSRLSPVSPFFQIKSLSDSKLEGLIMEGKVVIVIDVPPEFEGLLPEFVRLDDAEALAVLHLILSILQARDLEDDRQ